MKQYVLPILLICFATGCLKNSIHSDNFDQQPIALSEAIQELSAAFKTIEIDMQKAAAEETQAKADREGTRQILERLYSSHPYATDLSFIDNHGIMQVIAPAPYRKYEGSDIAAQPHIRQMFSDNKPSMSPSFTAVEGFTAVALQYPVFENGAFTGSIDMLLRPESLLKKIIEPKLKGLPVDIWVMEPSGMIIYDPDIEEIGRNIFTDSLYKPYAGLQEAARKISHTEQGSTTYDFLGRGLNESVKKYAYWNTINVYGTSWKVVLTKSELEGVNGKKTLEELGIKSLNEAFREFVSLDEVQSAIARKDKQYILSLFQEFYSNNPGLYCVQWVDEKCITRFGYPASNSLSNYKFDKKKNLQQINFIKAVQKGREALLEMALLEGNIGQMLMCPVTYKGKYFGMVYYVRIKP